MKKILVILGHPDKNTFCGALAEAYISGARESGAEVREICIGDLKFDPVLWKGYHEIQPLEPDLVNAQEAIRWAEHLVFVYPTWWGGMPALMKGFFDRIFLPRFAFKYNKGSLFWDRLLAGRSARLIVTVDSPLWYDRWIYRSAGRLQFKHAILNFSGIRPVEVTVLGSVKTSTPEKREKWIAKITKLGKKGV
jgi:NAD(P)H dehydrogenase (quinone)